MITNLSHHPPPSDNVCDNFLPALLLQLDDPVQEPVQMLVYGAIMFLKAVEPVRQIAAERRGIVRF